MGRLLHEFGYRLQSVRKSREGASHPDRNTQFEHINAKADEFLQRAQPVVSVDTKKKELVGDFKNTDREWQPKGQPEKSLVHDFPQDAVGKATPYGIYDMGRNEAWVSVGCDHDTPTFAVASLRRWWEEMGKSRYAEARELFITADAGGSNGYRSRAWKHELQRFADETRMRVHVSHFPPGTSKWNKIEHRLFCHITQNWRGKPLRTFETIVDLIGNTRTDTGLRVRAALDTGTYPKGVTASDAEMDALSLHRTNSTATGTMNCTHGEVGNLNSITVLIISKEPFGPYRWGNETGCSPPPRSAPGGWESSRACSSPARCTRWTPHLPGRRPATDQRASGQARRRTYPANVEVALRSRPLAIRTRAPQPRPTTLSARRQERLRLPAYGRTSPWTSAPIHSASATSSCVAPLCAARSPAKMTGRSAPSTRSTASATPSGSGPARHQIRDGGIALREVRSLITLNGSARARGAGSGWPAGRRSPRVVSAPPRRCRLSPSRSPARGRRGGWRPRPGPSPAPTRPPWTPRSPPGGRGCTGPRDSPRGRP